MVSAPTGNRPGRPRKPSGLALLHGDAKKNPQRVNKREPKPSGDVARPDGLSAEAAKVWDRLAPPLLRTNVLTVADVEMFTEFCELLVMARSARDRVGSELTGRLPLTPGQSTPTNAYAKVMSMVFTLAGRFGLTPSDRAGLVIGGDDRGDSSKDLLSG